MEEKNYSIFSIDFDCLLCFFFSLLHLCVFEICPFLCNLLENAQFRLVLFEMYGLFGVISISNILAILSHSIVHGWFSCSCSLRCRSEEE